MPLRRHRSVWRGRLVPAGAFRGAGGCVFLAKERFSVERDRPAGSYTTKLFESGLRRIAQKVGEEGVETSIAALVQDDEALLGEVADLLYHTVVLLRARGISLAQAVRVLESRHGIRG